VNYHEAAVNLLRLVCDLRGYYGSCADEYCEAVTIACGLLENAGSKEEEPEK